MYDEDIIEILNALLDSIILVQERFSKITEPGDFVSTSDGVILLDSISMRLQVIGESVKKIQKKDFSFLNRYAEIEWDKIARFRDLVSHHYEHVDYEIIFDICSNHIPKLRNVIQRMRKEIAELKNS